MKQTYSKPLALLAIIISIANITGCARMLTPLGDNTYDCNRKENPNSPYCHSFKSADESTEAPLPKSRFDINVRVSDVDKLTGIAPDEVENTSTSERIKKSTVGKVAQPTVKPLPHQLTQQDLSGMPVRIGPVIQKTWIKRYVTDGDRLTSDTTVYKEIAPTRWAGFPVNQSTTSQKTPAYPHKAPVKAVSSGGKQNTEPDQASGDAAFSQPGSKGPDVDELAPVQATQNGSNSSLPN